MKNFPIALAIVFLIVLILISFVVISYITNRNTEKEQGETKLNNTIKKDDESSLENNGSLYGVSEEVARKKAKEKLTEKHRITNVVKTKNSPNNFFTKSEDEPLVSLRISLDVYEVNTEILSNDGKYKKDITVYVDAETAEVIGGYKE